MGLSVLQWNANGLKCHFALFSNYVNSLDILPDIICIQETFLKPGRKCSLKGYVTVRNDRLSAARGGLLTYIRNSISFLEIKCPDGLETIGIQIDSSEGRINVYNVYISPDSEVDVNIIEDLFLSKSVVCGDFNAHHPLWGSHKLDNRGEALENIVTTSNHVLLNDGQGTFIVNEERTSPLDLTMVHNSFASHADWRVVNDDLGSDHFPVLTIINPYPIKESTQSNSFDIGRVNWDFFQMYIAYNFCDINFSNNIDDNLSTIIDAITDSIEKSIPDESPVSRKHPRVPYWNKDCQDAWKSKKKCKRKSDRSKLLCDFI